MIKIVLILLLPLIGGLVGLVTKKYAPKVAAIATLLSFGLSIHTIFLGDSTVSVNWIWIPEIEFTIYIDNVSRLLIALVTFISFLVQVFSWAYMENDLGIKRYYAKLGFFVTSMIGLLIADNLLLLFVFWELVGLASYLLIGFWYSKNEVSASARLAFMVNRLADACLLSGILMLYAEVGDLSISMFESPFPMGASLLIALGAFGKSAQLPFAGWLTKAMVGPTPISALIHAATMVAAGVYLLFRVSIFFQDSVLLAIAWVGTVTALFAALSAIFQFDIKKVLAYSTISQLGYMMMAIGVGAKEAALFHLYTHAFFKAGLFLGAASVIHFLHQASNKDPQDMRFMGGLKDYLPWTYRSFVLCGLALAGFPLFSGFMSKDGILLASWAFANDIGTWAYLIPDLAFFTSLLTAFYAFRMVLLVFWGDTRFKPQKIHAERSIIIIPLLMLGLGSIFFVHHWNPFGHSSMVFEILQISVFQAHGGELIPFLSILLSCSGLVLAYSFFKPGTDYESHFPEIRKPNSMLGLLIFEGLHLVGMYKKVGKATYSLSELIYRIDKALIDRFLHFAAISSVVFSKVIALFDRFAVDGPVNWVASLSTYFGKRLSGLSSKNGQMQITWLLIILIFILVKVIVF